MTPCHLLHCQVIAHVCVCNICIWCVLSIDAFLQYVSYTDWSMRPHRQHLLAHRIAFCVFTLMIPGQLIAMACSQSTTYLTLTMFYVSLCWTLIILGLCTGNSWAPLLANHGYNQCNQQRLQFAQQTSKVIVCVYCLLAALYAVSAVNISSVYMLAFAIQVHCEQWWFTCSRCC